MNDNFYAGQTMADSETGRAGAGYSVSPMPAFPPPQYRQSMPPPPPYNSFPQNPSAPQGFSASGQVYLQPQQHPSSARFSGTPPSWTGYGFHGPPSSYYPQVPPPVGFPSPSMKSLPGMTILAQNSTTPPGIGFGQQRNSFGVSSSRSVSEIASLGPPSSPPPGIGSDHLRESKDRHLLQDIPGVLSSSHRTTLPESTGCAQVWTSYSGSAPVATPQGSVAAVTHSSSVGNGGLADSGSMYRYPQLVNVVEQAILQSPKEKTVNLNEVLLQIRSLTSEVERAAEQIGTLLNVDLSSSTSFTVACPFDPAHKMVPEYLFQHYLRCPSNPKLQLNALSLVDSLHYRRPTQGHSFSDTSSGALDSSRMTTAEVSCGSVSSSETEFDIWGGRFYYEGSPAVVQAPLCTVHPAASPLGEVPGRQYTEPELADAVEPSSTIGTSGDASLLLPSRCYFLSKEIEAWEGLPFRSSSLVIEAAAGLGRVRKPTVVNWLVENSPAHGIVIDYTLACHIYSLTRACYQEVQHEACKLLDREGRKSVVVETADGLNDNEQAQTGETRENREPSKSVDSTAHRYFSPQVRLTDCARVFRRMDWLSAQLCPLYGSSQSKIFTLNLLKHSVVSSGRLLSYPLVGTHKNGDCLSWKIEVDDEGNSPGFRLVVEAAVAAVNERAVLERYLRTSLHGNRLPKFQLIQEYEVAVQLAAEERMRRPNYKPVLESDGLIWHRSQLEEKNKNKTREEILAEERDYKRRRMSYRGKKLKRTPTQVVRDIIEGHMEEIMAAGGIGCAVKQSVQAVPAALQQITQAKNV